MRLAVMISLEKHKRQELHEPVENGFSDDGNVLQELIWLTVKYADDDRIRRNLMKSRKIR